MKKRRRWTIALLSVLIAACGCATPSGAALADERDGAPDVAPGEEQVAWEAGAPGGGLAEHRQILDKLGAGDGRVYDMIHGDFDGDGTCVVEESDTVYRTQTGSDGDGGDGYRFPLPLYGQYPGLTAAADAITPAHFPWLP